MDQKSHIIFKSIVNGMLMTLRGNFITETAVLKAQLKYKSV